ncbi:hypothetical protein WME79_35600 [Sorangium sp. So ce726]|uniref:hypothetical protein n=1 Tax=Sorangium sp. So ce726 TaxID=3133319 RepID=UPI003F5EE681
MMPMMSLPMMGPMGMMPQMMGMMPQMMGMMPQMMGMMGQMPSMARMTCEMDKEGMVCKMIPMDAMGMDMLRQRCEAMMKMMGMGMPMMLMCGNMPMMMCMSTGMDMSAGASGMSNMGVGSNVASKTK